MTIVLCLTQTRFIEIVAPSQQSERLCICVLRVSFLPDDTICRLDLII